jgi:ribosomal protein S7
MEQKKQINNISFIYNKIIGFFIKSGNKVASEKIINTAFSKLSFILKKPIHQILINIFLKFNTFVEIKKIKTRGKSNLVPFPINFKRKIYLIFTWIIKSIKNDSRKIPLKEKLFFELLKIYKGDNKSKSIKQYKINKKIALKNRSNAHFRW